jgi:hypothetical protein
MYLDRSPGYPDAVFLLLRVMDLGAAIRTATLDIDGIR